METFDIWINVNVTAETEEEAEKKIAALMQYEMTKPVLERAVNNWDFVEWVEEDDDNEPHGV